MASLLELAGEVEHQLRAAADPDRAAHMGAYMRNQFSFYGVMAGPRRAHQKPLIQAARTAAADTLLDTATWCWVREPREMQYVATDMLRAGATNLTTRDLDALRDLVTSKSWWDTVDALAAHTVGAIVRADRSASNAMDRWIDDTNLWVARTAMLHQLAWKHEAEPARLFDYALRQGDHGDFFMRKAIGWALRSLSRHHPEKVATFVHLHGDSLSSLTIREATKHLP